MKRRAMILLKVFAAALLTLWFSNVTSTPYTVQAQGAIAQPPGDPTGATTGTAADVTVKDAKNPTLPEVMETVGHNKIAINFVWTLLAGFLVMFMQAGFAMVETGFTRAKNAAHTMCDELHGLPDRHARLLDLRLRAADGRRRRAGDARRHARRSTASSPISLFGNTFGLFGTEGLLPERRHLRRRRVRALPLPDGVHGHRATIPTGAMAERWKWSAFVVFGFFCRWWSTRSSATGRGAAAGWPRSGTNFGLGHGYVDFAGSSVVHVVGGVAALAGAIVLGPRIGKFTKDGNADAMPGHHIPMALAGTFILRSAGSASTPARRSPAPTCASPWSRRTRCSPAPSARSSAMFYVWMRLGKPDPA